MQLNECEVILTINLVSYNHGLKIHAVRAYPLLYLIKSEILFVVCLTRTIFRCKSKCPVHANGDWRGRNMVTGIQG